MFVRHLIQTRFQCRHAEQQDTWSIMADIFKTVISFELVGKFVIWKIVPRK